MSQLARPLRKTKAKQEADTMKTKEKHYYEEKDSKKKKLNKRTKKKEERRGRRNKHEWERKPTYKKK
jgi:hypothetical protein